MANLTGLIDRRVETATATVLHTLDAKARLAAAGASRSRLAIVSVMPPLATGVATYTKRLIQENPGVADVFTSYDSAADYFSEAAEVGAENLILPLELLGYAAQARGYEKIVLTIANSDHNEACVGAFLRTRTRLRGADIAAYVHDPVLFNLAGRLYPNPHELRDVYERTYGDIGNAGIDHVSLRKQDICGLSAILGNGSVTRIVVNSKAAADIVEKDLRRAGIRIPVSVLFHAVFRVDQKRNGPAPEFPRPVVGCFGVPSSAKYHRETVGACIELLESGTIATAVFAGFGASHVFDLHPDAARTEGLHVFDSPDDELLEGLIASTDVAIQLRRDNHGESSGVVPQLLEHGVTTICSPVGAFAELGDTVLFHDGVVTEASIIGAVERALSRRGQTRAAMREYVDRHRSDAFLKQLAEL